MLREFAARKMTGRVNASQIQAQLMLAAFRQGADFRHLI
jgi:hypothetical protein